MTMSAVEAIMDRWLSFGQGTTDLSEYNKLRFAQSRPDEVKLEVRYAFDADDMVVFRTFIPKHDFLELVSGLLCTGSARYIRQTPGDFLEFSWRLCSSGFDFALRGRDVSGLRTQLLIAFYEHVEFPNLLSFAEVAAGHCAAGESSDVKCSPVGPVTP